MLPKLYTQTIKLWNMRSELWFQEFMSSIIKDNWFETWINYLKDRIKKQLLIIDNIKQHGLKR